MFILFLQFQNSISQMNAMPVVIGTIAVFVIAYRFYFSFVAAKVAVRNDLNQTPARRLYDGQNYYPMNKWVLFGHHFAIMFEALFILTTIDAGTRIGRFILQETFGKVYKPFQKTNWLPGNLITSGLIVPAWGYFIYTGTVATIWPMFGTANQDDFNTMANPKLIYPVSTQVKIAGRKITVEAEPLSVNVFIIDFKIR